MNKEIIKKIIIEKQNEITNIQLVKRNIVLENNINYVLVGLRRAGKSYLMYQHIQNLILSGEILPENVLFINFEDERIANIKAEELGLLLDAYKELYNKKPLIFLDEIQNINGWEKFARRIADSKYRIFITGSNAKMLSKEIYTTLGGRFIALEVFPFSFEEYLRFQGIELFKHWKYSDIGEQIVQLFNVYFYFGGFAEAFPMRDKRNYLHSLYQKILLGDVVARNNIRNENAIRFLMKKLAESTMHPMSLARIKNVLDTVGSNISRNTLVDYLQYLTDVFLIFGISNYSDKLTEKETFKKRYFFDNGLLNIFLIDPETKLLENLVAIELKKKYGDDLFFYHKNIEVDFFIPQKKYAVQVSYNISDTLTFMREIKALIKLSEVHHLKKLEIITYNEEKVLQENDLTINVIPVWKWLLE